MLLFEFQSIFQSLTGALEVLRSKLDVCLAHEMPPCVGIQEDAFGINYRPDLQEVIHTWEHAS